MRGLPGLHGGSYTSFAYLLECLTPEEYEARKQAGTLPGQSGSGTNGSSSANGTNDGSSASGIVRSLSNGSAQPSQQNLALAGGLVAGAAMLSALGGHIAGGWGITGSRERYRADWLQWYDEKIADLGQRIETAEQEMAEASEAVDEATEKYRDMQRIAEAIRQHLAQTQQALANVKWEGDKLDFAGYARGLAALSLAAVLGQQLILMVGPYAAAQSATAAALFPARLHHYHPRRTSATGGRACLRAAP
ncbi:MAG: hypothetical protein M0Z94_18215 [Dehalococcoidales bacterium]|nr:hypothetical protein [Dehalococcoidales bacterium]